jgi:hypothetical protein
MIRRPLNERFAGKVHDGIKITTIRDNPWPVGKPIMLFRWSGAAYRSKQVNVAAVVALSAIEIHLWIDERGEFGHTSIDGLGCPLWYAEGFNSSEDMAAWFAAKLKPGQVVAKHLMRFRLWTCGDSDRYFDTHGKLP